MKHSPVPATCKQRTALTLAFLCCCAMLLPGCGDMAQQVSALSGAVDTSSILINEVVSANANSLLHDALGSPDWIEICNAGSNAISLSGCHISDNLRDPRKYELPAVTLQPGEFLILYATQYSGELPAGTYCTGFGISKGGESLYLTDRHLGILDSVEVPALMQDVSYARDANGSFGYCGVPTPGAPNHTTIVDDVSAISYASGGAMVTLSEVVPSNTNGMMAPNGRRYPWAELYNAGAEPVRLLEYYLSDNPENFLKWQLPDRLLQPGERMILYFSDLAGDAEGIHAAFRLGSEDTGLYMANGRGEVISQLNWEQPIISNIAVVQAEGGSAYTAIPTPGEPNHTATFTRLTPTPMDASDPVILNEVLPRNRYSAMDEDGDRNEWAELYNRSGMAVSLLGYALSDDAGDPAKWMLPDITIEPGEYLLVFLSGKDRREGELHASFSLSATDEICMLTNFNGMRQDSIPLDAEIGENISLGKEQDGQILYFAPPTPGAANNTAGFETLAAMPGRNQGVYISEVSAVAAAKSGKPGWIELHNAAEKSMDLAGWGVSDSIDDPYRHTIQELTLAPGGYAVINASTRTAKQTATTAAFGISASGDTIFLTDQNGLLQDYFETGALSAGRSAGRQAEDTAGARVFYTTPTPGERNADASYPGYAAAPVFSETALYHDAPFQLSISCKTEGAAIHYTVDGSKPTADSARYDGPITVSSSTPVRAVAIRDGLLQSDIVTYTYLFTAAHTLPVICINGSPENFSVVNSAIERSQRVEREMHMSYYEANGRLGVSAPCGLRASGSSTLTYAQKSFTIYYRGGYGRSSVQYPFFPGYEIDTFYSLVIRNGGQDNGRARLRDSFFSLAVEGMRVDNVATRPVVAYINGSYWGLYDLNENQNEDFLASHYGVDRDAVDIIRRNVEALAGRNADNKRVRAFGRGQDLSNDSTYAEYCQWVDVEYITDYLIAQTYFVNGDMFNQKYWRSQDNAVKWRPVYYDVDLGFSSNRVSGNILGEYFKYEGVPSQDLSLTNMDLYCGLPANRTWRENFIKRYIYIVETQFAPERLEALLDEVTATLRPEMERHIAKWHQPRSMSVWETHIAGFRECFAQRPAYALQNLRRYFNVSEADMEAYRQEVLGEAPPAA